MTILQFQTQQPGIRQSQRGWSILLQTVPGASRSAPECLISMAEFQQAGRLG